MKVLIIEDDRATAETIRSILEQGGNAVCEISQTGEEALEIGRIYRYNAIILDLGLPDINGQDLLKKLRESDVKAPILVLSGYQDIEEKVKALGLGADDYVTKPYNKRELIVRLQALMRRAEGHSTPVIKAGSITLRMDTQTIEVNGTPLSLTGKEYKILELLILRKGMTITKEMFLEYLYSLDEPEAKIIDVFMCKIRKKLLERDDHPYIETVWGRGYVLREPASQQQPLSSVQAEVASLTAV